MFSTLFADPAADEEEDSEASGRNIIVSNTYEFNLNVADDEFNANKKSLFATFIWSGSIKLAEKLVEYKDSINGRSVLEFGAAAGLPSLVCGRLSAELVCSSDYPSKSVIDVLRRNIDVNTKHTRCGTGDNGKFGRDTTEYHIVEHIWGEDASPLKMANHNRKYDIILAAECLWKHESHDAFIMSILNTICAGGMLLLSFSHHIAGLEACDLDFLVKLKASGFVEKEHSIVKANHMWDSSRIVDMHIVVFVYSAV